MSAQATEQDETAARERYAKMLAEMTTEQLLDAVVSTARASAGPITDQHFISLEMLKLARAEVTRRLI